MNSFIIFIKKLIIKRSKTKKNIYLRIVNLEKNSKDKKEAF